MSHKTRAHPGFCGTLDASQSCFGHDGACVTFCIVLTWMTSSKKQVRCFANKKSEIWV